MVFTLINSGRTALRRETAQDSGTAAVLTSELANSVRPELSKLSADMRANTNSAVDDLIQSLPLDTVKWVAKNLRFLSLCGGKERRDGLDKFVRDFSAEIDVFDIDLSPQHDLVCDAVWNNVVVDIEDGKYASGGGAPPCSTFAACRKFDDDGPPPLRGETSPEIYGFKVLSIEDREKVKIGTCIALRCIQMWKFMYDNDSPFWGETPQRRDGHPSVFKLPEALELIDRNGVVVTPMVQCMLEALTMKPTDFVSYAIDMSVFPTECKHPSRWWCIPWNGKTKWGPHPSLRGRQMPIPLEHWDWSMLRWYEPSGPYLTRDAANYTGCMNKTIANTWVRSTVVHVLRRSQAVSMVKTGKWANKLVATHLIADRKRGIHSVETDISQTVAAKKHISHVAQPSPAHTHVGLPGV